MEKEEDDNDILDTIKLFGIFWFVVAFPYMIPIFVVMMIIYYMAKATAKIFGKDIKDIEAPEQKKKKRKGNGK